MVRQPPKTSKQFAESRYVEVSFSDTEMSLLALSSINLSKMNPPTISVFSFSWLPTMIKGTDRITTQLAAMKYSLLSDLDVALYHSRQIRSISSWYGINAKMTIRRINGSVRK